VCNWTCPARDDHGAKAGFSDIEVVQLAYLGLSRLVLAYFSHRILFILPAEHYLFYQPNTLIEGMTTWHSNTLCTRHGTGGVARLTMASVKVRSK
jgi:hypothetical protein